jgi:predicted lipoprotein with Yx(FWY)xxD motif
MPRPRISSRRRPVLLIAGIAGLALAALAAVAVAATHTLNVGKNAKVVNFNTRAVTHENIVVDSRFRALYYLTGDSKKHPECLSAACRAIWPPAKVRSTKGLSKAAGIKGRLGTWRHNGFIQLTLGGRPLYRYFQDGNQKKVANGEDIHSFGGTWHVIKVGSSTSTTMSAPTSTTTPSYPSYP